MSAGVHCSRCGLTAWPQMELNAAGKLAPSCPQCGNEHPEATKAEPAPLVSAVSAVSATRTVVKAPAPVPTGAFDVIAAVRDRLTYLQAEEARLEGVLADARARLAGARTEAKKLQKMIKAADRVAAVCDEPMRDWDDRFDGVRQ